jgi:hypothetical protein
MCNQTVCLIAAELERQGISTACLVLLEEVAKKVKPPRALVVPFRHGYPLGKPLDALLQRTVMEGALALLNDSGPPPVLRHYHGG